MASGTATLLKTTTVDVTSMEFQQDIGPQFNQAEIPGIINVLPAKTSDVTPSNSSSTIAVTDAKQYSGDSGTPLFAATRIACGWSAPAVPGGPITSTCSPRQHNTQVSGNPTPTAWSIPISYNVPTGETIQDPTYGTPLRETSTTFEFQTWQGQSENTYAAGNFVALPVAVSVSGSSDASTTTTFGYDEPTATNQAGQQIVSPQGAFGNQTSKQLVSTMLGDYGLPAASCSTASLNAPCTASSIKTQAVYNTAGMPVATIDANQNITNIYYDSSGLFPNRVRHPVTSGISHDDYYVYDQTTGSLTSHADSNGNATTYSYDSMNRIVQIQYPDNGGSSFCYTDSGTTCPAGFSPGTRYPYSLYTSTKTSSNSGPILTMHLYDGWGRQYRSAILSDADVPGHKTVDTTYDWAGRVASISNPYQGAMSSTPPSPSCQSGGFTCFSYDALGRKTMQIQPDTTTENQIAQYWCYDGVPAGPYCHSQASSLARQTSVEWTDITDESGNHSQQVFDALGRMQAVIEPDKATGNLAMETDYTYDVFGDLIKVNQVGSAGSVPVTRYFAYDMPSRVVYACNPETLARGQKCTDGGGTFYWYDSNSNLLLKQDNRGVFTHYSYDALNRPFSKTYTHLQGSSTTPSSCYMYDQAPTNQSGVTIPNSIGRLTAEWTQVGACPSNGQMPANGTLTSKRILSYDQMGRLKDQQQQCLTNNCSAPYALSYTYDLTGKLTIANNGLGSISWQSGYDPAGRLLSVIATAAWPDPPFSSQLFNATTYGPAGITNWTMGEPVPGTSVPALTFTKTYDSRLRVNSETVGGHQ